MKNVRRFLCGLLFASLTCSVLSHGSATNQTFVNIVPQLRSTTPDSVGVPKADVAPTTGTWKYKQKIVKRPGETYLLTYSTTVKDDGDVWTFTHDWQTPDGTVTDILTLKKGTLALRKEWFKHFAKPGRPWLVTMNFDFNGDKVTGTSNRYTGQDKPVAVDLSGPASSEVTIGCLPLADGYSTSFRNWDPQTLQAPLTQLRVVGMERVTVPAGTFDTYKVELTSAEGGSDRKTIWIAKDSRIPVKDSGFDQLYGDIITELVP